MAGIQRWDDALQYSTCSPTSVTAHQKVSQRTKAAEAFKAERQLTRPRRCTRHGISAIALLARPFSSLGRTWQTHPEHGQKDGQKDGEATKPTWKQSNLQLGSPSPQHPFHAALPPRHHWWSLHVNNMIPAWINPFCKREIHCKAILYQPKRVPNHPSPIARRSRMAKLNCLNLDIIDIDLAVRNNWNAATWQSHQSSVLSFRWNIAPASSRSRKE